ncbi:restriction endonuclease subunit S [Vibrio breoganii]
MTGRYQTYAEYCQTSNKWIGLVPKAWEVVPLKYLCANFVKDGPHETPKFQGEGVPFLSVDSIQNNELVFEGCRYISLSDHIRYSLKCKPKKGDILLGKAASVGKVAYISTEKEFNVWSPLAVITPKNDSMGRFIYYSLLSKELQNQCDVFSNSNTQKNLGMSVIDNLSFPLPSEFEAEKIANFLDHETVKIDTLITKQEKLIELLKEKRQAVISHAVTKGLNPQAPMKESGVEWLGEVPERWAISPSKRLFPESKNRAPTSDMQLSATQDYGVISQKKFMQLAGRKVVQLNSNQELRKKVHVGDFVISMRSFQGGLERAWDEGGIRSSYVVLKPSETVNKDYFQYLFKSGRYIQAIQSTANFIRDGQDMNYQNFVSIDLPLPSLEEQEHIASYLRDHINKIDSLVEKAQKAISLMQERKTALTSAAVTGKIDVRDWQEPTEQQG